MGWFGQLPLWLDLDGLRVVHACWSEAHMAAIEALLGPGGTLSEELVVAASTPGTSAHDAVEVLLKGPEIDLDGAWYFDGDGHRRDRARLRWWDPDADTLERGAVIPSGAVLRGPDDEERWQLPDRPLPDEGTPRYTDATPVIFGHYWWTGRPRVASPTTACVDYSVAAGGPLVAYRWTHGDTHLDSADLVAV